MPREIKVRAWDRHNKVWIGPYTLKQLASDDQFNYDTEVHPVSSRFEDFDWVEYAGVKDRQGKEIWEGDILGLDDPEDTSRAFVVFHQGAFKLRLVQYPTFFADDWDWVVIGNIYENLVLVPKEAS